MPGKILTRSKRNISSGNYFHLNAECPSNFSLPQKILWLSNTFLLFLFLFYCLVHTCSLCVLPQLKIWQIAQTAKRLGSIRQESVQNL